MYTITHNGKTLYDPRLPGFPVERPKLAREANVFDTLTFTLYPPHQEYGDLDRSSSILGLYQDSGLVAQFIPVYQRTVFNGGIEYKCKNILCCMEDFYYRPLEFSGTASGFIDSVLTAYNARVDNAYKITKGNIHPASVDYKTSEPKTCFSALKAITDANGGYLNPRFENGTIYLDYLQDADLPVCEQKIVFGDNMTDLFIEKDTDNCYSVLYPFGTNSDNEVVSIAAVNGGVDYLENASAVASYGRREKKLTWANVETPAELLSYAQAKLSEIAAQYYEAVSLSAVDLHYLDVNIPALSFLFMVDCVSAPHGYSHRYPATKMEIPLDEPKSESITLGTAPLSMTDRITLERQKNEAARSAYGRAISKANKDIEEHYQHVVNVTDQGMEDCFGIIGVKLDAQHKPQKDAQGNYVWAGPNDSPAEIWGHLHRNAWETQIMNNIKDANGNIISLAEVYTDAYGNAIINAINDQRTGTAKVRADRIKIDSTSGSSFSIDNDGTMTFNAENAIAAINAATAEINADKIKLTSSQGSTVTLDSKLSLNSDGYIELNGNTAVWGNLRVLGVSNGISASGLTIGSGSETQGEETGSFSYRGESFNIQRAFLGYPNNYITLGRIMTTSATELDFNHSHAVSMEEVTSGSNAGKVHAVIGEPVTYNSSSTTNRESFFDIAASQTYLNGVAAAEKSGWNSAAAAITFPGIASGEHLTDTLVIPDTWTATDAQGPTKNIGLRLEKSETASAGSAVTAQYSEDGTNWTKFLRINVGNFYVDGWGAAYRKVSYPSVRSEQETGDTLSMTFGSPSSTVGTADTITYTLSATQWNGNTAFAKVKTGNDDVLRLTLDATPRYRAGSASVGLASPDWGTAPSPLTDSRTVSVSTTGRVDANGTAANLTKAIALYLTQGSFDSAHKMTVSLRDTSSSGTIRAETDVDASGIYYAGWNSAASAVSYPGTASGQVLNATLTLPSTGASSSTPAPTKDVLFRVEKSATPSANAAVTAQYSTNDGSTYRKFLRINVGDMYTAGQNSVNLSQAPSWQNGIMVVSTDSPTPKSTNVELPSFSGSGGTSFDSNHKTTVHFSTPSVSGPLVSYEVDASGVYADGDSAGYSRGYSAGYAAGQTAATFDISKLSINLGSDYDPTAQVPTKTADRISGKIGVWYDGTYYGELRTFSLSINHGTPYINNPAAGYVRGAVSINNETLMGNTVKLTESQISSWGGPIS